MAREQVPDENEVGHERALLHQHFLGVAVCDSHALLS